LEWTICVEALEICYSKLGEKVAVKILEKSRVKEQADIKRVNREIKILKRARHGNVIQLYEVIDTPTAIYLMMENAEG
jgi:5'-AMP-activated protein kinase, catalytic alpha subunit